MYRNKFVRLFLQARSFHCSRPCKINEKQVEEIRIPVPWGHIAGRWWGNKNAVPIIALHGMQDNAATFDRLIPLLEVPSVLCLDVPGHGQSSHVPKGLTLHYLDNILYLRHVLKTHFGWDQDLNLLGHSFGASLWFTYSALFPASVSKFVSIETALFNMSMMTAKTVSDMRKTIDSLIELNDKKPLLRTYDELLKFMMETRARNFPLTEGACKVLLTRGLSECDGKFYFSVDPRLGNKYLGRLTIDFILELSSRIECDVLNIRAIDGIPKDDFLADCEKSLEIMKKNAKTLEDVIVEGGHHVHLENPQIVAPLINKFFSSLK